MAPNAIELERTRRDAIWADLSSRGNPECATPELLSDVGVRPHRTAHGIYRELEQTGAMAPPHGVTLSVLATSHIYADTFDDDAGIYHYPGSPRRIATNAADVEGTKNAARLNLPVFVVLAGPSTETRRVRRAWVADWDDERQTFLLAFERGEPPPPPPELDLDAPFNLRSTRSTPRPRRPVPTRPGRARFCHAVFKRCGTRCAFCDADVRELLDAAHVCPVSEGGSDDPRNGLVACPNHHRAFDLQMIGIRPQDLTVVARNGGPSLEAMGVSRAIPGGVTGAASGRARVAVGGVHRRQAGRPRRRVAFRPTRAPAAPGSRRPVASQGRDPMPVSAGAWPR